MTTPDGLHPALTDSGIDRAAEERSTDGLLDGARMDASSRVLVLHGDAAPLGPFDGAGERNPSLHFVAAADVPDGARWAFLGRDAAGAAILGAVFPQDAEPPFEAPSGWGGLRVVGGDLSPAESGVFVEALSLGRWLLDAPYCPACGTLTELRNAGWSRHCPNCGREHFPRTDPAVIVAITSATDPDALLLGSNALWGANRFSCFAGFAEAGESLESAVVREVREESGVVVRDLRYRGSQAWPYPRSLMVGFLATAIDDAAAEADGDEIAAVRWFTRAEIGASLAGEGDLLLPGRASIAHRLISGWHAGAA
ncbi:NAD(+) diphosphatase [Microbacterium sp. 4R-513]|uniref:NAD(+) diphosphatase n=1 Tax=Microbacterium sp. 4R-513 TaxID=2567934 RepID=UPI0013E20095|nr:NAD(+) diphosphatase [Microbacterium sp. 4R-513]QIG40311.1 NAD(+) diphosphatase [Microbacterium sp. 4R-513]